MDERERALVDALTGLLGRSGITARDDFFEVGGDSLVSLRLVAAMRRRGFALRTNDVFAHPTLADLARGLVPLPLPGAGGQAWGGRFPLPPIARWHLRLPCGDATWWNQAVRLTLPVEALPHLSAALEAVVHAHPLLRSRLDPDGGSVGAPTALVLLQLDPTDLTSVHGAVDPAHHPFRAAVSADGGDTVELMLAAHHLVIDAASWAIVIDDLVEGLDAVSAGRAPAIVPEPPLAEVVTAVQQLAAAIPTEVDAGWRDGLTAAEALAARLPPGGTEGGAVTRTREIASQVRASLERRVREHWRADLDEAVLAAWAIAMGEACRSPQVGVWVETHGRTLEGLDLSRSVGWLAALRPVRLPCDPSGAVRAAKAGLRDPYAPAFLERHGAGVRSLGVVFNHLGRLDPPADGQGHRWLRRVAVEYEGTRDPTAPRPDAVELESGVLNGSLVLRLRCAPAGLEVLEPALDRLHAVLLEWATDPSDLPEALIPSDFAEADLTDGDLAALADHLAALEDP